MAVTKALRYQILRRDNHTCRYCGAKAPDAVLRIDHVIPKALGGGDVPENLVTACHDCNAGKSATPADAALVADVAQDALRWARAMEIANHMALDNEDDNRVWHQMFDEMWSHFTVTIPSYRGGTNKPEPIARPFDWRTTITELAASGMNAIDMRDAVNIAMSRPVDDEFRYFVGVVRRKIEAKQDVARDLLDRGEVT